MALVFKLYTKVPTGDGFASGWIGYDDTGAGPWPLTRVRYENTSSAQGGQSLHYALYNPASDLDNGNQPAADGDIPPNTALTTRNVQGLGLMLTAGRYPGTVVAAGWALSTSTG